MRLIAALILALSAAVAQADEARVIAVGGHGEVSATPDIALVSAGVRSFAPEATRALADNSAAMTRVLDALRAAGVADRDMRTVNLSLHPRWRQSQTQDGRREQEIAGYEAANQLRVTVRDLDSLGALLDALARAGANDLGGVAFDIADKTALMDEARRRAVRDARAKAALYAEAAGVALGDVLSIREISGPAPMPQLRAMAEASLAVPVAEGEMTLSVSLALTYGVR